MEVRTIDKWNGSGATVLLRVDYNLPISPEGEILDDIRMTRTIPTINYLRERKCKIVILTHLGRPKGKAIDSLRVDLLAEKLSELLGEEVEKLDDVVGESVRKAVKTSSKSVIMLENVRFHPGEESNSEDFARELASLGDLFVSDGFGVLHRAHASVVGIAKFLPSYAGFLVKEEIDNLKELLRSEGKMVAIVGGKKVSGKIKVITEFLKRGVHVLVGGGMVGTFFKALGRDVGKSFVEWERIDVAKEILSMEEAKEYLHLPVDVGVANEISEDGRVEYVAGDEQIDGAIVDVGPRTVAEYYSIIRDAHRVFWNGPLGIYEIKAFAAGSNALLGFLKTAACFKVAGGGETAMMVSKSGLGKVFDFVSTGGGATLDFLVHGTLPGLEVLKG